MEIQNLESEVERDINKIGYCNDDGNAYQTLSEIYIDSESDDGIFVLTQSNVDCNGIMYTDENEQEMDGDMDNCWNEYYGLLNNRNNCVDEYSQILNKVSMEINDKINEIDRQIDKKEIKDIGKNLKVIPKKIEVEAVLDKCDVSGSVNICKDDKKSEEPSGFFDEVNDSELVIVNDPFVPEHVIRNELSKSVSVGQEQSVRNDETKNIGNIKNEIRNERVNQERVKAEEMDKEKLKLENELKVRDII